jgi:hypothetical protein
VGENPVKLGLVASLAAGRQRHRYQFLRR